MLVEFCSSQKYGFKICQIMHEEIKKVEYGDKIIILTDPNFKQYLIKSSQNPHIVWL
jgi:5S rRNA maturation endonuclease (ribonuclease M5)